MCAASAQCTQFLCVPTTLFCGRTPLQRTFDCGASPLALSRLRCIRCIPPLAAAVFASAVVPHLRVHTQVHALHNMASHTARSKKIVKEKGAEPDEFEESVAQVRLGVGRSSTIRLRIPPLTLAMLKWSRPCSTWRLPTRSSRPIFATFISPLPGKSTSVTAPGRPSSSM